MLINLFDNLPLNETFILLSKQKRNILFGNLQKNSLTQLSAELKIPLNNLSRYRSGVRNMTLGLFLQLTKIAKGDIKKLQGQIKLRIGRNGTFINIGPYLEIDSDWVYISELLRGDGYLSKRLSSIVFTNKETHLINLVHSFFDKLGLKKNIYLYEKRKDAFFLYIRSKLLVHIFSEIFNIPTGKKKEINLPDFIKNTPQLLNAAIAGIFDAEGSIQHVRKTSRRITISMISRNYLNDIQEILSKLYIESSIKIDKNQRARPIYRLYIFNQTNLKKFYQLINFKHPAKKEKLKKLLNSFDKNRIPTFSLRTKVMLSIKKDNNTRRLIANDLNIPLTKIGNQLYRLQKMGLVELSDKIITNKGSYGIYGITKSGERFLKT